MKKSRKLFNSGNIALILIILQLIFKVWVELAKSKDLVIDLAIAEPLVWSGILGWAIIIPLMVQRNRASYSIAAILGLLNGVIGGMFPLLGVCHHYFVGPIIFLHGFLIVYFSYKAYRELPTRASVTSQ